VTYGDTVAIPVDSPLVNWRGAEVAVCGFRTVTGDQAAALSLVPGTLMILIERGDGTTIEVPASWLRVDDVTE
jgi:hypothetical protein